MVVITILTPAAYIFLLIGGEKMADSVLQFCYGYVARFFLFMWGIQCRVKNPEMAPSHGPVVFIANHRAQLDIVAGASALPLPARFLGKAELLSIPFFGLFIRMLAIPVRRQDKSSREQSMEEMKKVLLSKGSVFIYPEGTRNRNAEEEPLKPFKDGAFRVAIETKSPIMVQVLQYTDSINNPNFLHLIPGKVTLEWLGPYASENIRPEDLQEWKEGIRQDILHCLRAKNDIPSR